MLHLAFVTVASGCLLAGWWQVERARSGNLLSYGYAVEWPVFAVVAGIFWWQLVHDHPNDDDTVPETSRRASFGPQRQRQDESPQLRVYNDDLSALATRGRPKTWRNPKGLP